jgi:hypothetical protein
MNIHAMKPNPWMLIGLIAGALSAPAQDAIPIPDWVIAGIAAVETGSLYQHGELVRYRDRRDGAAGEVGPWQLSPAALSDMGARKLRDRIRRDTILAESMTRAWLMRCFAHASSWKEAVSLYHTGWSADHADGFEYAERVYAAGRY